MSSYDGEWQGTTSQNLKVTFTVNHGEILTMNIRITMIGFGCIMSTGSAMKTIIEPTALATGNFTPSNPIENDAFTVTRLHSDALGNVSSTFVGTFSSPDKASGTYEHTESGTECDGTMIVDWTAKKTKQ